jgi:NitT/TauT family transport system permease protein
MTSIFERKWALFMTPIVGLLIGAGLWEYFGERASRMAAAPLSETASRFVKLMDSGELPAAVWDSLQLYIVGFVAAIIVAAIFGLLMARSRFLRVGIENYVMFLYATPMVALVPFITAILGLQFAAKFVVVFLFGFFPILYNTLEGARSLKPELIEVATSFRSRELPLWRDLLIPYTLPFILTGIRQASGRALVGVVASEFLVSSSGIGGGIRYYAGNYQISGVFAYIIVLTAMGIFLMWLGRVLEIRFAAWRGLDR